MTFRLLRMPTSHPRSTEMVQRSQITGEGEVQTTVKLD
jgi:hypothetical protein